MKMKAYILLIIALFVSCRAEGANDILLDPVKSKPLNNSGNSPKDAIQREIETIQQTIDLQTQKVTILKRLYDYYQSNNITPPVIAP